MRQNSKNNVPSKNVACVSVVIPLFNEHGNVRVLAERLAPVLESIEEDYEVILVDDGSRDATWSDISQVAGEYHGFRGIRLSRNFGHQSALLAGLAESSGAAVISMDGDLQHPPEVIPQLLDEWKSGNDIVTTKRMDKQVTSKFKRVTSRLFYQMFTSLSGVPIEEGASDFRLLSRGVVAQVVSLPGNEIFLRGMVEWVGFHRSTVSFKVEERYSGESKYSLKKMIQFALSGILSFSTKPLRISLWMGAMTSALSFAYLIYALIQVFRGETIEGWASLIGVQSFMFGVLFVLLGVIGLYLARMHEALIGRPPFIVSERFGTHSKECSDLTVSMRKHGESER